MILVISLGNINSFNYNNNHLTSLNYLLARIAHSFISSSLCNSTILFNIIFKKLYTSSSSNLFYI